MAVRLGTRSDSRLNLAVTRVEQDWQASDEWNLEIVSDDAILRSRTLLSLQQVPQCRRAGFEVNCDRCELPSYITHLVKCAKKTPEAVLIRVLGESTDDAGMERRHHDCCFLFPARLHYRICHTGRCFPTAAVSELLIGSKFLHQALAAARFGSPTGENQLPREQNQRHGRPSNWDLCVSARHHYAEAPRRKHEASG